MIQMKRNTSDLRFVGGFRAVAQLIAACALLLFCANSAIASSRTFAQGDWHLIVFPDTAISTTMLDIFGDDVDEADYGETWILYSYSQADGYTEINLNDPVELGRAYWFIHLSEDVVVDVDDNRSPDDIVTPDYCQSQFGCWEIPLEVSSASSTSWNMVGVPSPTEEPSGAVSVTSGSGTACDARCTLSEAAGMGAVALPFFRYNPSAGAYESVTGEEAWAPWMGFWVGTHNTELGDDLNLLIQSSSPASAPVVSEVLAHWPFEEGNGSSSSDLSGNNFDGSLTNHTWTSAVYGSGVCFDGSDAAEMRVQTEPQPPTSLSISAWIKVDSSASAWGWIASFGDSAGLYVTEAGGLILYTYNGNSWPNVQLTAAATGLGARGLKNDEWHHVAGTYDPTAGYALYLDGRIVSAAPNSGPINYGRGTQLGVGALIDRGRAFNGCLDEVQIYGSVLSSSEVSELAMQSINPEPQSNTAPLVDAGIDQTIVAPANATLNGTVDDDGLPNGELSASWVQLEGPANISLPAANIDGTSVSAVLAFTTVGRYTFELRVSDGELSSTDVVSVNVVSAMSDDEDRLSVVAEYIAAFEANAASSGRFTIAGSGFGGSGEGYILRDDGPGTSFPASIADALIDAEVLRDPPPTDPQYVPGEDAYDLVIYSCAGRVGVFANTDVLLPSVSDQQFWDDNGCNRFALDNLGFKYFSLSRTLSDIISTLPPTADDEIREVIVAQYIEAFEKNAEATTVFPIFGSGFRGNGVGFILREDGPDTDFPLSIANALVNAGHLDDPPPVDPQYTLGVSTYDLVAYLCGDRVGVFANTDILQRDEQDQEYWDNNGCPRFALDNLGFKYFALSRTLDEILNVTPPTENDILRVSAVGEIVAGLQNHARSQGSFTVAGTGFQGSGEGYFHFDEQGVGDYPESIADGLVGGGYLGGAPIDPAHVNPGTDIDHDFLVYQCAGGGNNRRVAVFARTDTLNAANKDAGWWNLNSCPEPVLSSGQYNYFQLSQTLPNLVASCATGGFNLFLEGDSITAFRSSATWANYTQYSLQNYAVGGSTVADVAGRIEGELALSSTCFEAIVVIVGVNEINQGNAAGSDPVPGMQSALMSIVNAGTAFGVPMIISTTTPFGNTAFSNAQTHAWSDNYNTWVMNADWPTGVTVLDVHSILDSDNDRIMDADYVYAGDYIHPNAAGAKEIADAVDSILATTLAP